MLKIIQNISKGFLVIPFLLGTQVYALEEITSDNELGDVSGQAGLTIEVKSANAEIENIAWYDTHWENNNKLSKLTGGILLIDNVTLAMAGSFHLDVIKNEKGKAGSLLITLENLSLSGAIEHIRIGSEFDVNNDWYSLNERLKDPDYLENGKYGFSSSMGGIDFSLADLDGTIKMTPGGKYGKSGFNNHIDLAFSGFEANWYDDGNTMGVSDVSGTAVVDGTIDLQPYDMNGFTYQTLEINSDATINATVGDMSIGEGSMGGLGIGNMHIKSQINVFARH